MIGMLVLVETRPSPREGAAQSPLSALLMLKLEVGAPNLTDVPTPSYSNPRPTPS